jgi:RNA-directed DNA polymerase
LEKRGLNFVRYADDIAIYATSQRAAERIMESVIEWLSKELKLEVNRTKSGAGPSEQSGLLGFQIDREGASAFGNGGMGARDVREPFRDWGSEADFWP